MRTIRTGTVRAILAILVVGVFIMITAVLALYPIFGKTNVELAQYADFFAKTSSVYTGIVGVIIGYYFGRTLDTDANAPKGKDAAEKAQLPPG
jgi:cellobiose-specific phosphotransferase system component IIC